jgi:catalase
MAATRQGHTLAAPILVAGLGLAAALGIAAAPGTATAQDAALATQIVDALNKVYGVHPGFRANHAKGVVAEGFFKAAPEAARLSKAVLFSGTSISVTVRFSDSTGIPNLPDGLALANPHGMAIKFHLPGGDETNIVINALKFFPVSSGEEFRDMLLAVAASPPEAAKPTKLEQFAASHPNMPRALATVATAVRYVMAPERLVHLSAEEAAKQAQDFLIDELPARLSRGPVMFRLKAQLAAPGDSTKDASIPWPESNETVELGMLTITKSASDSLEVQKTLLFLPGQLIDGIEPSDDPLIEVRDGAYAVSLSRRTP